MKFKNKLNFCLLLILVTITIYYTTYIQRKIVGISHLQPGVSTYQDVLNLLGEPDDMSTTSSLNPNIKYYFYSLEPHTFEKLGIFPYGGPNTILIGNNCHCIKTIIQQSGYEIDNLFKTDIHTIYGSSQINPFYHIETDANYLFYPTKGIAFAERSGKIVRIIYFEPEDDIKDFSILAFLTKLFPNY